MPDGPLVTIGIPTYGRRDQVLRAIASARAQTHPHLEILVADDASPDDTVLALQEVADADDRVRIHMHPQNVGHVANYRWVAASARGEFFMWLADDDWIDPEHVARSLAALASHDGAVLASSGTVHEGGGRVFVEPGLDLREGTAAARVMRFFAGVAHNSALFGLMRTGDARALPFPERFGGDWTLVASVATRGAVVTTGADTLHRSLEGLSSDAGQLVQREFAGAHATNPHREYARRVAGTIARGGSGFEGLAPRRRLMTAGAVYTAIVLRFVLGGALRRALHRGALLEPLLRRRDRSRGPEADRT